MPSTLLAQPVPVALPQAASADSGSTVFLPITVGDVTGRNVLAFLAIVEFDNQVLDATGVSTSGTLSDVMAPLEVDITPGRIRVSGATTIPLNGSGTLVNLLCDVMGSPGQTSDLRFAFFLFNTGDPPQLLSNGRFTVNVPARPDIEITPTAHDFGSQQVGVPTGKGFTLANAGDGALDIQSLAFSGANPGDFVVTGLALPTTLAPGDSSNFQIEFTPGAPGSRSATLQIQSNDPAEPTLLVQLSGLGTKVLPDIDAIPPLLDFGSVFLGQFSVDTLLIRNSGDAGLVVTEISLAGANVADFTLRATPPPFTIAPGQNQKLLVGFQPVDLGMKAGIIAIASNDPDQPVLEVIMRGIALAPPEPDISLSPDSLVFGDILSDSLAFRNLTVSNVGAAELAVGQPRIVGPNAEQFHLINVDSAFSLPPAGARDIVVAFSPSAPGPKRASLQITSNDPDESFVEIPMTGIGQEPPVPVLVVQPDSIDFGVVRVDFAATRSLVVQNIGSATLAISQIRFAPGTSASFSLGVTGPLDLAPGEADSVQIRFAPNIAGRQDGLLEILSNDPQDPNIMIDITGIGEALPEPVLDISPDSLSFGILPTGRDSLATLRLLNSGAANLDILEANVVGADSIHFGLLNPDFQKTLLPGDSVLLRLRFAPQTNGRFRALLRIRSNDPQRDSLEVPLRGESVSGLVLTAVISDPSDNIRICEDSVTVRLTPTVAGGQGAKIDSCLVNGQLTNAANGGLARNIVILPGANPVVALCFASDSLGQLAVGRDSLTVFGTEAPNCTTQIVSPRPNQLITADSIRVFVSHTIISGSSPFTLKCEINGIEAVLQDSLFVATIPCIEGRFEILATTTVVDSCGKRTQCSDRIEVECALPAQPSILLGVDEDSRSLVRVDVNVFEPEVINLGPILFQGEQVLEMEAMAFDPISRRFLIVSNKKGGRLFALNPADVPTPSNARGIEVEFIGVLGSTHVDGIAIHPETGDMFGVETERVVLLRIDRASAETKTIGPLGFENIEGLAFSKQAKPVLYGIDNESGKLVTIDMATGRGKAVGDRKVGFKNIECLEFAPDGRLFAFSNRTPDRFITIDAKSGIGREFATIGSNGLDVEGLSFFMAEPSVLFTTGIENPDPKLPSSFGLSQNYPNPFNPATKIDVDIPASAQSGVRVRLQIYNILGKLVRTILDEATQPGHYTLAWDGTNNFGLSVPSGIYVYRLRAGEFVQSRRMVLLK